MSELEISTLEQLTEGRSVLSLASYSEGADHFNRLVDNKILKNVKRTYQGERMEKVIGH